MATFLFDEIIFGPVTSRRLGSSLGINLLPTGHKYCNFDCLYCECGLTSSKFGKFSKELPSREKVASELDKTLASFRENRQKIDTITFAGNGEPTLHPSFPGIIDDTIRIGEKYFPDAKIAVLSNATLISREEILHALQKVDFNILKLDSAFEDTIRKINCPLGNFSLDELISNLKKVRSNLTIQTLFVRGSYKGYAFDNTSPAEVDAWLRLIGELNPELVMVYTIARDTPIDTIQKISPEKLNEIAAKVRKAGISVTVSS
jgi:wyosine [tRNA(Phe)-imidazoG37] synthetase (radical SAM superfamily)